MLKKKFVPLVLLLLLGVTSAIAQTKPADITSRCYRWRTQVDPSKQRIAIDVKTLNDLEVEEGIGCLLKLKGLKNKGRFYGTTRANYNRSEGYKPPKHPASVAIAALYYASYLFYENWEHAGSVVLFDEAAWKINSGKITERAYKSYQKWFKNVLEIGLQKAREQKLDPLAGSGISWS
jgi:hypothetical protein